MMALPYSNLLGYDPSNLGYDPSNLEHDGTSL